MSVEQHKHVGTGRCPTCHHYGDDCTGARSSLYDDLISAGIPVANHFSDLYFPVTEQTRQILAKHPRAKEIATTFINQAPKHEAGDIWFDVPFGFDPFWIRIKAAAEAERRRKA